MPTTRRLFVALWPSVEVRAACAALRDGWEWHSRARPTGTPNLHVTIRFLGAVAADRVDTVAAAIAIRGEPFAMRFDRGSVWDNGVAALEATKTPEALARLHAAIGVRLAALGVDAETRRYRPHVTLARDATESTPPASFPVLHWPVDGFVLVESRGGRYAVLREYPLESKALR